MSFQKATSLRQLLGCCHAADWLIPFWVLGSHVAFLVKHLWWNNSRKHYASTIASNVWRIGRTCLNDVGSCFRTCILDQNAFNHDKQHKTAILRNFLHWILKFSPLNICPFLQGSVSFSKEIAPQIWRELPNCCGRKICSCGPGQCIFSTHMTKNPHIFSQIPDKSVRKLPKSFLESSKVGSVISFHPEYIK